MIYYILHSGKGLTIEKIMCEKDNVQFYNDKANINTLAQGTILFMFEYCNKQKMVMIHKEERQCILYSAFNKYVYNCKGNM